MNEQMTLPQSFLFISDAAHGWLKAPLTDLALLGIEQEISPYSYVHKGYVYLEEDCDYLVYMTAYHKATPVAPTICEEYQHRFMGRDCYAMYKPPVVTDEWLEKYQIDRKWWSSLKGESA